MDVLDLDGLDVEADGRDRGHRLIQLELVQDGLCEDRARVSAFLPHDEAGKTQEGRGRREEG